MPDRDFSQRDSVIMEMESYFLQPGYIYANREAVFLNTVLGSCVAVALWDRKLQFGGMCHFIYPVQGKNSRNAQYGDVSIPYLVHLMRDLGSKKSDLMAHVVGGGVNPDFNSYIGEKNAKLAEEILKKLQIDITTLDVGGSVGKKTSFNTLTGELLVYTTTRIRDDDWYK